MKTLFKCNYCAFTDEDPNAVEEHEKNCLYNPIFKNCASCNRLSRGVCMIVKNQNIKRINCPDWKELK
jgi:hypothetical protein